MSNNKYKIDWRRKLTSRKFWLAVAAFVVGIIVIFTGDAVLADRISGVIMSGASVVAYLIAEGWADAANGNHYDDDIDNAA